MKYNVCQKTLCAMLRLFNNQPHPKDYKPIKRDLETGMGEAVVVYLSMKVESYIHQEINFNLVNKKT